MFETIILYNGILLVCYFIANYLDRTPKYVKLALFILSFALSFVCGFRSYHIGLDTQAYYTMLDEPNSYLNMEYGFRLFCTALLSMHFTKELIMFTISFITNGLFVLRFYTLRAIVPMRYSIPLYFVMVYFMTFSGIRQMLAVAIAFFATYYIFEKKKIISFIILILLASSFHISALISFSFLMIEVLSKNSTKKWMILKIAILVITPFFISYAYNVMNENYGFFFEEYRIETPNIGFMIPWRMILLLLITFIFNICWRLKNDEQASIIKKTLIIEFITLALSGLGYFFANISRIGWYFLAFTPVLYAYVLCHKTKDIICFWAKCMIWICVGYTYVSMFLSQTNKLVPYEFFWNI